jgi:hypothetical protein
MPAPRPSLNTPPERLHLNKILESEEVGEFLHKPQRAKGTYRIVVLKKNIREERGQQCFDNVVRYFLYITNDFEMSKEEVVFEANGRCDQENLNAHLKGGIRSLHAPLNTLDANWAYMVMVSLAWTLKAWFALLLPSSPRWRERHDAEREAILRMEFRTFLNRIVLVPAQIVRTGRRIVFRLLAWRPEVHILVRSLQGA